MSPIPTLNDLEIENRTFLIRVDFSVPLNPDGTLLDDQRMIATLPTLREIEKKKGRGLLISHLGRPKGWDPKFSLAPVAKHLSSLLKSPVKFVRSYEKAEIASALNALPYPGFILLENIRYLEEETDPSKDLHFSEDLASFADGYINDAFATTHRNHSSITHLPRYFPQSSACGYLLQTEMESLMRYLDPAKPPFFAISGGSKISSKLKVIRSLIKECEAVVIVGAMAFTFLSALGYEVGLSLKEADYEEEALKILKEAKALNKTLLLPEDFRISTAMNRVKESSIVSISEGIKEPYMGVDIGPKSIENIKNLLTPANTVFWNGPAGVFEVEGFDTGTLEIAQYLASHRANSVIGGGDSLAAVKKSGLQDSFSHLSTGGGACLKWLENKKLPGIEVLINPTS